MPVFQKPITVFFYSLRKKLMIYPPFSVAHIIYLVISVLLVVFGCKVMYSGKITEKTKMLIIKICAATLPIEVFFTQLYKVQECIASGYDNAWVYILPNSYCTYTALFMGIFVLLGKYDGIAMHFLGYHALVGCLPSVIYPDYLNFRPFFSAGTLTSMALHVMTIWITLALTITGKFKPTFKKFYCYPIGFLVAVAFGAFQIFVLGSEDAMNVTKPLISGIDFCYWYVILPVCSLGVLIMTWLMSKIKPFHNDTVE